jgi:dihydropteroate synthase
MTNATWAGLVGAGPSVMGIINVTPDSFSDGGRHFDPAVAIASGLKMISDGAAILDIGGESTRPGAARLDPAAEQARILPVLAGLRDGGVPLSVDTRNAATMAAALDAGAAIINDVSALTHDPGAAAVVAARGCPVILMHMRGTPVTMNDLAQYGDVGADVARELAAHVARAERAGVRREAIAIDPGFGFAKNGLQNASLLRDIPRFTAFGVPVVVGVSRKRFIASLSGAEDLPGRDAGSLAAGLFALGQGAAILRVHDVLATFRAMRVWQALAA